MSITLTKSVFSRCPLSCYYIPATFPLYDWESGGKDVESGRKKCEGEAFGRIVYDAVGCGTKRYETVRSGTWQKMFLYLCSAIQ